MYNISIPDTITNRGPDSNTIVMVAASLTGLFWLHYSSLHRLNYPSYASADPEACIAGYPEGSRYAHDSHPQSVQITTVPAAIRAITRWCQTWFGQVSQSLLPDLLFLAQSVLSSLANELTLSYSLKSYRFWMLFTIRSRILWTFHRDRDEFLL